MKTAAEFDARSLLFIPADAERFIAKAAERGADVVVLDLEDGVAPASRLKARAALQGAVQRLHQAGVMVYVRVNHDAALLADDVAASVVSGADGIVMPKVEAPEQLVRLASDMHREELIAGRAANSMGLVVLIETPQGVCRAPEIARASSRIVCLGFGAEDFSTAMGIDPLVEGMGYPAQAVAIAAVAAGIHPIGLPGSIGDFTDLDAFRALAVHARRIGVRGSACIHPAQVRVLNDVFGGTDEEAVAATRLLAAFNAGVAEGKGAIALDGRMIDEPIAQRARLLLKRRHARLARQVQPTGAGGQDADLSGASHGR